MPINTTKNNRHKNVIPCSHNLLDGAPLKKRFHSHVRPLFFCLDVRFGREWQGNACACEMNRTDSVKPDLKKV